MMARLGDVCILNMGQSPDSASYNESGDGLPFFQGNADFGIIHPNVRVWCNAPTKIAHANDILISVRAPIGALNIADRDCCIGRGLAALTVDNSICEQKYLWYAISSRVDDLNSKGTGSTFKAISKSILADAIIPLPSLETQRQIVAALDKVSDLITLLKRQLDKLDELAKARFVEMFGDPIANPKEWPTKPLLEMGFCKNGMNFHYDDAGVEIHCLGVGDFQDHSIIADTATLPMVSLNEMPSEEYLLQDDDIVFVRSNGNKELVGRRVAVYPGSTPTTFSGFCIRYRKRSNSVTIPYLLRVLKADSMRVQMAGRGANIQNLNQQILASLVIPVPPIELQDHFATLVTQIDKSKSVIQQGLGKLETLKSALMQKYFG